MKRQWDLRTSIPLEIVSSTAPWTSSMQVSISRAGVCCGYKKVSTTPLGTQTYLVELIDFATVKVQLSCIPATSFREIQTLIPHRPNIPRLNRRSKRHPLDRGVTECQRQDESYWNRPASTAYRPVLVARRPGQPNNSNGHHDRSSSCESTARALPERTTNVNRRSTCPGIWSGGGMVASCMHCCVESTTSRCWYWPGTPRLSSEWGWRWSCFSCFRVGWCGS